MEKFKKELEYNDYKLYDDNTNKNLNNEIYSISNRFVQIII